jgi:site-specific DNA recombinase
MPLRPADNSGTVTAGIYCRLSLQRDGDTTKVGDQERICRRLAADRGWTVAEGIGFPHPDGVYADNNESAWKIGRKRKGWEALLADVDAGHINAIVVYHGDRLLRTHEDLLELIHRARAGALQLASPVGTRDIGNYDDQFILEIEASMAKRESANISRRQKQRFERWRLDGRVMSGGPGGRRFGFGTDGVTPWPPDRCSVATRELIDEQEIVREIFARTLAREPAGAIMADLRRRGITTPAGKPVDRSSVKRMIRNPRYAGLMPDGETKAAWEPVVDRDMWERARLTVDMRADQHARGTRPAKWLLSGIAACHCGNPMRIAYVTSGDRKKGRTYRTTVYACARRDSRAGDGCGKVYRNAGLLDAYVSARVVRLLNDPRQPEGELPVAADSAPEWVILQREHEETEKAIADYATSAGHLALLARRLSAINARMAELREREAGDARSRLLGRYRGITAGRFADLPLDVRRALVAASFRVTVLPASGRGPGFRTGDVRLDPA